MFEKKKVFTVRIIYKNGYVHDFDCFDFRVKGNEYKWTAASAQNIPVLMNVDEIAAVWQVGVRSVIRRKKSV